uniref:Uncharacterized protein n=1 Tax=Rhodnius prolixus TaxID=13249 RepID=T1HT20_RHOPR
MEALLINFLGFPWKGSAAEVEEVRERGKLDIKSCQPGAAPNYSLLRKEHGQCLGLGSWRRAFF